MVTSYMYMVKYSLLRLTEDVLGTVCIETELLHAPVSDLEQQLLKSLLLLRIEISTSFYHLV